MGHTNGSEVSGEPDPPAWLSSLPRPLFSRPARTHHCPPTATKGSVIETKVQNKHAENMKKNSHTNASMSNHTIMKVVPMLQ